MNLRGESAVKGLAVDELAVPESAVIGLAISEPVTAHAAPEPAVAEAALDELVVAKPVVVFVQDENVPIMRDIDDNSKKYLKLESPINSSMFKPIKNTPDYP